MTRPWQITIAFTLCVAVLFAAMTWVSMRVIRLQEDEARAQQQMALEEDVRLALSRIDAAVNLIIAEENARPHYMYSAFHPLPRAFTKMFDPIDYQLVQAPSRLLFYDSPLIHLHFQINPDGAISSPQVPQSNMRDVAEMLVPLAKRDGAHERINTAQDQLAQLRPHLKRELLLASLPDALRQRDPLSEQLSLITPMAQTAGQQAGEQGRRQPNAQNLQTNDLPPNQVEANPQNGNTNIDNRDNGTTTNAPSRNTGDSPNSPRPQNNAPNQPANTQPNAQPNGQAGQQQGRYVYGNDPEVQQILEQQEKDINTNRRGGKSSSRLGNLSEFEWAKVKQIQSDYSERQQQQKLQYNELETVDVSEGIMKPLWIDDSLILARRVQVDGIDYVQGVWFDWEAMQTTSLDAIKDVFPNAKLLPVTQHANRPTSRMLTTIPAMLDIRNEKAVLAGVGGGIPSVLVVAWICMLLAAVAVGVLLVGAVTLSERRGAFVSAVTHELRTPLTTFRMYTEMLVEKMVPDEARQTQYLETMRDESNRLSHLVENVLAYARLERGKAPARVREVSVQSLLEGVRETLTARSQQVNMQLRIEPNGVADTLVKADPAAVEQILFNLVDNACKYASEADDRAIHVEAIDGSASSGGDGTIHIRIRDHGPGVSKQESRRLFKPFRKSARDAAHSAPGVGLGLALSLRLAHAMGGKLRADTNNDGGACFELSLPKA